eukprot:scaffold1954_cov268-Pinguiococcus_pyrenoidosus.AAC.265
MLGAVESGGDLIRGLAGVVLPLRVPLRGQQLLRALQAAGLGRLVDEGVAVLVRSLAILRRALLGEVAQQQRQSDVVSAEVHRVHDGSVPLGPDGRTSLQERLRGLPLVVHHGVVRQRLVVGLDRDGLGFRRVFAKVHVDQPHRLIVTVLRDDDGRFLVVRRWRPATHRTASSQAFLPASCSSVSQGRFVSFHESLSNARALSPFPSLSPQRDVVVWI